MHKTCVKTAKTRIVEKGKLSWKLKIGYGIYLWDYQYNFLEKIATNMKL